MPNREEALRKIFEATGVDARLTDEQKRELLAHLEDAVEAKVAAGTAEMEAVGQAFGELGDLKRIARNFPATAAVVTPEGPVFRPWSGGLAEMGLLLLCFFAFIQVVIMPQVLNVFRQVQVSMPWMTSFFAETSVLMRTYWPIAAVLFLALGVGIFFARRKGVWGRAAEAALAVTAAVLCAGALASVTIPLISLLEGIGVRR